MSEKTKAIIGQLFGSGERVPVFDRMAYELPCEFWEGVLRRVQDYEVAELQYTTLLRLSDLAREMDYYEEFLEECGDFLQLDIMDVERFLHRDSEADLNIAALNEYLFDFLSESGLNLEVDLIRDRRKQRLNAKKRELVREAYRDYEEQRTAEAFREFNRSRDSCGIPVLMLDRIELFVFSERYMSYRRDVRDVLKQSKFGFFTDVERAEFTRRDLLEAGYSKDEVDMYVPVNLDQQFDFIRNRSVLEGYRLTKKPRKVRDGSGWSYVWHTNGMTYRFNFDPPANRPVSLMVHANMQRLVWEEILGKAQEQERERLVEEYDRQFLKEPNFIPPGRENMYRKHESWVFWCLLSDVYNTYMTMMERVGFDNVDNKGLEARVSQVEVCWNNPVPLDVGAYLSSKYDLVRSLGLSPQIDAKTPLMHTKFFSDVDTGLVRFDHKEYRKAKGVLRSELIFGSELRNRVDITGKDRGIGPARTLSDYFHEDLDLIKKYLYFKVHRRYGQVLGVSGHGYYNWRNCDVEPDEGTKRAVLEGVLDRYCDLPEWLRDVRVFDVLADQEYVDRGFFRNLSEKQYRLRVREDERFVKMGHGRYRFMHPALPEYRKLRDSLGPACGLTADRLLRNSRS